MPNEEIMSQATPEVRDSLVAALAGGRRAQRQEAAHRLAQLAREDSSLLVEVTPTLVDALTVPEAQTRWECLEALSRIAAVASDAVTEAFDGAEESLFDENSAPVRLAAFKFLCRYGALSAERSLEVWPLVSEAVQCYHGDPEYREMLISLLEFARSDAADEVKVALAERMRYDEKNGRGFIRAYSAEIRAVVAGKE